MKLDFWAFFENLSRKFKFLSNPTKITGTLHENVFTFITISHYVLLTLRNVLDKSCRKNQNTHFMFNNFFPKVAPFMKNVEKFGGARGATNDVTRWRIRVACWISKATRTHALTHAYAHPHAPRHTHNIYCFSTTTMIRECASLLRCTYIVCLFLRSPHTILVFVI